MPLCFSIKYDAGFEVEIYNCHHLRKCPLIVILFYKIRDVLKFITSFYSFIIFSQVFPVPLLYHDAPWEGNILFSTAIGFDHMTCSEQWVLIKSGHVPVLSLTHQVSAHFSDVSSSTIGRTCPGWMWIPNWREKKQTWIHPMAWSTGNPGQPRDCWERKVNTTCCSHWEILRVFVTYFHSKN